MKSRFDAAAAEWDKGDLRQRIAVETSDTILKKVPLDDGMDLIDFGAGTGLLTYRLIPYVRSITAVDTSPKMLEVLESKSSPEHTIKTACCNIIDMPLDAQFDGIISSMAMHHVDDTGRFLETLHNHLRPGGFIAIADLDKEDGSFHSHGNDGVFHFGFERDALKNLARSAGFESVGFETALTINKPDGSYPIFLLTAYKR